MCVYVCIYIYIYIHTCLTLHCGVRDAGECEPRDVSASRQCRSPCYAPSPY